MYKVNERSGTKSSIFNVFNFKNNDSVKVNQVKLLSHKPKHPSIRDINFNGSLKMSRNNSSSMLKKGSVGESGIYEEINLEVGSAFKETKLNMQSNFQPSSYNEEDNDDENYEENLEQLPKKEESPNTKRRDSIPNLSTIPSLAKNNKMIYNSNLAPLSERSYSLGENINDPFKLNANDNKNNKTHSSNEINSLMAAPLEKRVPVFSNSNVTSIESELQDSGVRNKSSIRKKSESFHYGANEFEQRRNTNFSEISSIPNQFKKTKFDPSISDSARKNSEVSSNMNKGSNVNVRRRTIIEVIKNIGDKETKNSSDEKNSDTDELEGDDMKEKNVKPHSRSKSAVGIGIIYGLFLFLFGVFFSLDTLTGKMGADPLPHSIFMIIIYLISIGWILFLFFDIQRYVRALNCIMEKEDVDADIIRDPGNGFYSVRDKTVGHQTRIYEAQNDLIRQLREKSYIDVKSQNAKSKSETKDTVELVDFTKKEFRGYLLDNVQPFNMYLKGGIGVFCLFSIVQCSIEVAEQIESILFNSSNLCKLTNNGMSLSMSLLQLIFSSLQFLFIFLKGNIVISTRNVLASVLTMHVAVNNIIVWYNNILIETLNEYYLHVLEKNVEKLQDYKTNFDELEKSNNLTDCYDPDMLSIQKFAVDLKPYLYPATIEFSITCATLFAIMWNKIGRKNLIYYSLPPFKKRFKNVGSITMPYSNLFIMLDCTKTSKGLFFGLIIFAFTLFSYILLIIYKSTNPRVSGLISEATELILISIGLILSVIAFFKVIKNYSKATPIVNMFDVVLEIVSLCGIYAYSINCFLAILNSFGKDKEAQYVSIDDYFTNFSSSRSSSQSNEQVVNDGTRFIEISTRLLSLVQSTIQTLFILECLRRYADKNKPFLRKPARELITALLIVNVTLWFFDTFSAKRFDTKQFLTEHFGEIKWSIINAFSSPLAIFYRFHSSVCLSDIWYGLYYGENEPEVESESPEHRI